MENFVMQTQHLIKTLSSNLNLLNLRKYFNTRADFHLKQYFSLWLLSNKVISPYQLSYQNTIKST